MIVTEELSINGRAFVKTCSDAGYLVEREGKRYAEAIDPKEYGRTYTETGEPADGEAMTETERKAAAFDILVGAAE